MKSKRLVLFVLVGIAVGVAGARLRGDKPSSAFAPRVIASDEGPPRAAPAGKRAAPISGVRQIELSATDPRYDPLALHDEEELHSKDVFEREPRDETFAPVMERRIHAVYETVLRELKLEERVHDIHVECRTLSCYTYLQVSKADALPIYNEVNGILLGNLQTPSMSASDTPGMANVTIYSLLRPAMRDEAAYKKFIDEAILRGLEYVKQQRLRAEQTGTQAPPNGAPQASPDAR